jgi:hypothetical protein
MKQQQKTQLETTVRYVILIVLGAGVNLSLGFGFMVSTFSTIADMIKSGSVNLSTIPNSTVILSLSYLLLGILYSTSVSLLFHPKRIISPIFVQIMTSVFVGLLAVAIVLVQPVPIATTIDWASISAEALGLFIISVVPLVFAGIFQEFVVRALVGLNGTRDDTDSFELIVLTKLENVLKLLRNTDFQDALNIDEEKRIGEHSYVFHTSPSLTHQFFIAVVGVHSDLDDKEETQLATLCYKRTFYGITKTGEHRRENMKDAIERELQDAKYRFDDKIEAYLALQIALDQGLRPTEAKLLTLRSMPPHTKALLIGLVIMFGVMTGLWHANYVNAELTESFYIFGGLAILTDLLPLLRTKRKKYI